MQTSESPVHSAEPAVSPWLSLHPAMLLFELLRQTRVLLPILVGALIAGRMPASDWMGGNAIFFAAVIGFPMFAAMLRFISYRYCLEEGHITIREGILSKKVRRIPVKRIHNINTSQNILARALKVQRLDLETAGGGEAEASLSALTADAVADIKEWVRKEKAKDKALTDPSAEGAVDAAGEEEAGLELYRITPQELAWAGATSNRVGVVLVALFAGMEYMNFGPEEWVVSLQNVNESANISPDNLWLLGATGLILLFLVAWMFNIAATFMRWHKFTIRERDQDLEIKTGLLTIRHYTLPRNKIQALSCATSTLRRPFGFFRIKVRSAGHVGVQEGRSGESDLLTPLTDRARIGEFARMVWPEAEWDGAQWFGVHKYTRLRHFRGLMMLSIIILTALYFLAKGIFQEPLMLGSLAVLMGIGAWFVAHLSWKQTAYALDRNFVYIKTGFLGLHFWVIPRSRVQSTHITQTPFQRIRNLASVNVNTAGSGGREAVIPNIDLNKAARMFNQFAAPPQNITR